MRLEDDVDKLIDIDIIIHVLICHLQQQQLLLIVQIFSNPVQAINKLVSAEHGLPKLLLHNVNRLVIDLIALHKIPSQFP